MSGSPTSILHGYLPSPPPHCDSYVITELWLELHSLRCSPFTPTHHSSPPHTLTPTITHLPLTPSPQHITHLPTAAHHSSPPHHTHRSTSFISPSSHSPQHITHLPLTPSPQHITHLPTAAHHSSPHRSTSLISPSSHSPQHIIHLPLTAAHHSSPPPHPLTLAYHPSLPHTLTSLSLPHTLTSLSLIPSLWYITISHTLTLAQQAYVLLVEAVAGAKAEV